MSYKVAKARSLGYQLTEEDLRLLYYIWAVNSKGTYYDYTLDGTCYATGLQFIDAGVQLELAGLLEIDPKDRRSARLTEKGRALIHQL